MNTKSLAESYLKKASDRLDILDLLFKKEAYSDVIRESQEVVELSLKGMLRFIGVEPPKIHDVGGLLLEHRDKFPKERHKKGVAPSHATHYKNFNPLSKP